MHIGNLFLYKYFMHFYKKDLFDSPFPHHILFQLVLPFSLHIPLLSVQLMPALVLSITSPNECRRLFARVLPSSSSYVLLSVPFSFHCFCYQPSWIYFFYK